MSVYRLTNAQWEYIRLLLLVRPRLRGCLPADSRQTLEAILHVLTTGGPWHGGVSGSGVRMVPLPGFGHICGQSLNMLKKIDFSRHKFECLQIQTDSPQLLIRRSGEREGRKRARSSGSGGPNPQLQGRRMVSFSAKIA